jgi:mycofactocin system creatininase family protein
MCDVGAVLADEPWTAVGTGALVLVPVGSTEQHGPHLPLNTDSAIAEAVAHRAAQLLTPRQAAALWVLPVLAYGSSGEHQSFPGTCSIGSQALQTMTVELVRSVRTWADRVVVVNGHGGNLAALRHSISQLRAEGHPVAWLPCMTPVADEHADAHAGFTETSLMLHLRPEAVRLERAVRGNVTPIDQLLPQLVRGGVSAVSASGVLGDPTGATAAQGARLLELMAADVARRIIGWQPDHTGLLSTPAESQP